eukprot:2372495-Alexandrium_andersonii.AAC.1
MSQRATPTWTLHAAQRPLCIHQLTCQARRRPETRTPSIVRVCRALVDATASRPRSPAPVQDHQVGALVKATQLWGARRVRCRVAVISEPQGRAPRPVKTRTARHAPA